ncbi:MAG: hypothetical protein ACI9D0_000130 [Bacteroidia bacterium]|jgi:hypothetical protein
MILALGMLVAFAPAASAQKDKKNAPTNCTVCEGLPEVMGAGGILSHGGFVFGRSDTDGVDEFHGNLDIRWIETEHFEIGYAGPPYKVSAQERKAVQLELATLAELFPEIKPKKALIDPWLRAHMYAVRCEQIYAQFMEIMQVTGDEFPSGEKQWDGTGTYWGEGPHLGQKGKYELMIMPSEGDLEAYLSEQFGVQSKKTNRWNVNELDTISVTMQMREGDLKKDLALHGHVAFNLAHNLLDGFKHYSYDTQIWLHEGLAHWFEREINPKFNSFDSGEGSKGVMSKKEDWDKEVLILVRGDKAPRMAELANIKNYADLTLDQHYVTWSMVKFLLEEHATAFANINKILHGRMSADGSQQNSSNLDSVHRDAFKSELGMNYSQFDTAWQEWVKAPKGKK